jgi:hypothetical protein
MARDLHEREKGELGSARLAVTGQDGGAERVA